jgi:hypothetical protein
MVMQSIEPILDADLPLAGKFLHENHDATRSAEDWAGLFRYPWKSSMPSGVPNNGFLLRDGGTLAGVVGAIYSEQIIHQAVERFCNITSWVVLESHRGHSTRLLMACLAQRGYHFTNFSPMPVVENILKFLKFVCLEKSYYVVANRPWPWWTRYRIASGPAAGKLLNGSELRVLQDHRSIAGLTHLAVAREGRCCYVALVPCRVKGLPSAEVLHAGDAALFTEALPAIGAFLLRRGILTLKVESRFVEGKPAWSSQRPMDVPKYYRSDRLKPADVSTLYSERVLLL